MKKKIIFGFVVIFLIILATALITKQYTLPSQKQVTLSDTQKAMVKNAILPLTAFVYTQATLHNPQGDFLPDTIDDNLKKILKDYASKI